MQTMPYLKLKIAVVVVAVLSVTAVVLGCGALRAAGANGLLHPGRRTLDATLREAHPQVTFAGADVTLSGWKFPARNARRGTVIYLHGIADNRGSGLSPALRLSARGFDVIAYDSRAHGDSTGEICTFGFYEKRDLQRVLDVLESGPVFVIGSSLGGAVALQAAAEDARISGVVAAESFSDLRTVATERAPWFFPPKTIRDALTLAGKQGGFAVDAVSPMESARRINVPVLLIHGALDRETPPEHSRRIFDSLRGQRRLLLVEGVGHNQSLQPASVWTEIENWIESVVGSNR
jgi:pimeloyl-ACP methyl ester carboxylesterase